MASGHVRPVSRQASGFSRGKGTAIPAITPWTTWCTSLISFSVQSKCKINSDGTQKLQRNHISSIYLFLIQKGLLWLLTRLKLESDRGVLAPYQGAFGFIICAAWDRRLYQLRQVVSFGCNTSIQARLVRYWQGGPKLGKNNCTRAKKVEKKKVCRL